MTVPTDKVRWPFDRVTLQDHVTNLKHISNGCLCFLVLEPGPDLRLQFVFDSPGPNLYLAASGLKLYLPTSTLMLHLPALAN